MAFEHLNDKNDGFFDDILPDTYLRKIVRASNNKFLLGAQNAAQLLTVDPVNGIMANIGPFGNLSIQGRRGGWVTLDQL